MKIFILIFTLLCANNLISQWLPLTLNKRTDANKSSIISFKEEVKSIENYFKTIDIDKKGSGYKPFKRWEYYWKNYLQADGTIAPADHLWNAWIKKQQMSNSIEDKSNWTSLGPFSQSKKTGLGRINTILVDPNNAEIIYIGAPAGGLWKSIDNGINWIPLTDHLPQIGVSGIAIDPNNSNVIYIATGDDDHSDAYSIGVLKSLDGGTSWDQTGSLRGLPSITDEIIIDPQDSNRVWVATSNGLFLSTDAGNTWIRKLNGVIFDFKLKPGESNTIYALSSLKLYKSNDGGNNFLQIINNLPDSISGLIEVTPAASNNVYLLNLKGGDFDGIYKSTNSGSSFVKTLEVDDIFESKQAWYDLAFSVSDIDQDIMFVGVIGIWKSIDGGNDFTNIKSTSFGATYTHPDIHFMRYYNGILYAGTDGGIYRSTDNGNSFLDLTENLSISQFYSVSVSNLNSNSISGGLQDNGGFAMHDNIWNKYHGGDGTESASDPNNENTFYSFIQFGITFHTTTDGGLTYSPSIAIAPSEGNWVTPLAINNKGEIFAGFDQVYKLENNVWQLFSSHNFGGKKIEEIEFDPNNNDIVYISIGLNLFKSIDSGKTFTALTNATKNLSGINISSIEIHSKNSKIVWLTTSGTKNSQFPSSGLTGGGVYKSANGGLTFIDISDGLPNESKFVVRHQPFTTNNSIYVGTALGVYHRNDDSNLWEVFSNNLPNVAITDLEFSAEGNNITAATYGRGLWRSSISSVLSVDNFEDNEFTIYPNPSSETFNIKRSSNLEESMSIEVYDIIGKSVLKYEDVTDVNYTLDMKNINKGIYFLRISIGNKRLVRKLILN
jgi:photosystem II stability/assembly factor-like uncharacterized protein